MKNPQEAIGNTQPPQSSDENISKPFGDKIFIQFVTYWYQLQLINTIWEMKPNAD